MSGFLGLTRSWCRGGFTPNILSLEPGTWAVDISTKRHPRTYMLVDEDVGIQLCYARKWFPNGAGYATAKISGKRVVLHRLLFPEQGPGQDVDHINQNRLDNRKENLRLVSHSTNTQNSNKKPNTSSKYKGVTLRPWGKFQAFIRVNGVKKSLGMFESEEDAARAYNEAAIKAHGPKAWVNTIGAIFAFSFLLLFFCAAGSHPPVPERCASCGHPTAHDGAI